MVDPKDIIQRANQAFEAGEVTKTDEILRQLPAKNVPPELSGKYYFLLLGAGLYGRGDPDQIRRENRRIRLDFQPSLRYRLALRTGDIQTAKKIRSQDNLPFDVTEDFGWSAALSCIWSGKRKMGMRLYHKRMHARNFGSFLPKGSIYEPYHGGVECGRIFLEQGVGDWLLHLAVLKRISQRDDHIFIGEPRSEPFVRRYFPNCDFRSNRNLYKDMQGQTMHGSGDYLAAAFLADGKFAPVPFVLDRKPSTNPVFGVCWRGGSAQNRREERRIPLHMFLDMLPRGYSYVALQADITEDEKEILRRDGRVTLPNFDIKQSTVALFDAVSQMAGVISIDSANWHLAGLAQVPIFALMNKTIHWYWGPKGDVASVYPDATVSHKSDVALADLNDWCAGAKSLHASIKSAYVAKPASAVADRPVFLVGSPRSGTSMVTGALAACGLWMGNTVQGNANNAKGYFENADIRNQLVKPALTNLGVDPLGVTSFVSIDQLAPDPTLRAKMLQAVRQQGYDGKTRWGYKEPKLTLLWPMWADAFPDANWVILERDREAIVKSCLNTGFMARHSTDAEFWRHFVNRHDDRLAVLENTVPNVTRINTGDISNGDMSHLKDLVDQLGLAWNQSKIEQFIDPKLFGRHG